LSHALESGRRGLAENREEPSLQTDSAKLSKENPTFLAEGDDVDGSFRA